MADDLAATRAMRDRVRGEMDEEVYRHVTSICSAALDQQFRHHGRKGDLADVRQIVFGLDQVVRAGLLQADDIFICAVFDRYEAMLAAEKHQDEGEAADVQR